MELSKSIQDGINDVLKEELNDEFRKAVMPVTVFVIFEVVLGLVGNFFVLYVFFVHYTRCTYRQFVLFLAIIDILSCFTTMPGEVLTQLNWFNYKYGYICKIKSFFNVFTVCADSLCLLTIAVDRYRNQCVPRGWQFTESNSRTIGYLNCLAAFIMAFPCAILWGIEEIQTPVNKVMDNGVYVSNVTITICEKDQKYAKTNHPVAYSISVEAIVSLSLFAMAVIYIKVARNTVNEEEYRGGAFDDERRLLHEDRYDNTDPAVRRNTLIMAILTAIFVVTIVTYFTLLSLIADNILQTISNSGKAVYFFFFRLYFINHVMNPIVYGILDPEFRTASRAVLCRGDG